MEPFGEEGGGCGWRRRGGLRTGRWRGEPGALRRAAGAPNDCPIRIIVPGGMPAKVPRRPEGAHLQVPLDNGDLLQDNPQGGGAKPHGDDTHPNNKVG